MLFEVYNESPLTITNLLGIPACISLHKNVRSGDIKLENVRVADDMEINASEDLTLQQPLRWVTKEIHGYCSCCFYFHCYLFYKTGQIESNFTLVVLYIIMSIVRVIWENVSENPLLKITNNVSEITAVSVFQCFQCRIP